jgi:formamidase
VGLLANEFTDPYMVHWTIVDGVARSAQLPNVAVRGVPFVGIIGVAPSSTRLRGLVAREAALVERGGAASMPNSHGATPAVASVADEGLTTVAPREIGGNMDIKHLHEGSHLLLPVDVPGALVSVGDLHFAQGDGESCGVAIEVAGKVSFRCSLRKTSELRWRPSQPSYEFRQPNSAPARNYIATTGIPIAPDGANLHLDVYRAAQVALKEMIGYLVDARGYTREQAYVIVSVAADLSISSIVNFPNALVSALLPLDIFE